MKKKEFKKLKASYVLGSLAITAGAVIVIPKIIDSLSNKFYKPQPTVSTNDEEDWGPEIVKKNTDDNAENEENNNGEL